MVNFQISDNPIHYTTRLQEQLRPFLHLLQCTSVFSICKWWVLRSGLLPQSSSACWTLPASWPSRLWWLCGEGRGKEATITECLLCARLPARRWMHLISFNLSRAIPSLFSWLRELNHIFFFFQVKPTNTLGSKSTISVQTTPTVAPTSLFLTLWEPPFSVCPGLGFFSQLFPAPWSPGSSDWSTHLTWVAALIRNIPRAPIAHGLLPNKEKKKKTNHARGTIREEGC